MFLRQMLIIGCLVSAVSCSASKNPFWVSGPDGFMAVCQSRKGSTSSEFKRQYIVSLQSLNDKIYYRRYYDEVKTMVFEDRHLIVIFKDGEKDYILLNR